MLRMTDARLPKGCAKHSDQTPEVKGSRPHNVTFWSLAGFPALGECFPAGERAWLTRLRLAGHYTSAVSSHAFAASGFTHSNSGS